MQNRYHEEYPETREEDEAELERLEGMTDEELEVEQGLIMKEYAEFLDQMSPDELYRYRRRTKLANCISARTLSKQFDFAKEMHRQTQWGLWKLRYHRRTGVWPGSDS